MRFTFSVLAILVLTQAGCTMSQRKPMSSESASVDLLVEQELKLNEHALRLESLASTQDEMLQYLNSVQVELASISNSLKKTITPSSNTQQLVRAKPSEERIVRQSRDKQEMLGKAILGRVEYIWIEKSQRYIKARIDTGAKSSSLHAKNIQRFERDGEKWVRFALVMGDELVNIEAPLEGHVKIRQAGMDELERRPVVKLKIQLGDLSEETEFTLADRSEMLYPVLLGRSFLRDIALVDVAKKFTRKRDPKRKAIADAGAK